LQVQVVVVVVVVAQTALLGVVVAELDYLA
jgi:hypothetical protein